MTAAAPPRATTPRPAIQVSAPSAHSARSQPPAEAPPTPTPAPTPPPAAARRSNRGSTDYLSDRATAAFIRRTLCPQQPGDKSRNATAPIEELLPPLTSRNDVDLQLYAFLAVILREFVQAWYSKITPDETFVAEVVQIVAHCTRALEQRLRKVDLESLLFDEIPDLLDRHITGTSHLLCPLLACPPRQSHSRSLDLGMLTSIVTARRASRNVIARPPTEVDPREVYHSLCPLPYLSPVPKHDDAEGADSQRENEAAYRGLLVRGVLAILLPTEDLENPCLESLVGGILSETIIGNIVAGKACQPWLLWEGLSILARNASGRKKLRNGGRGSPSRRGSRSEASVQPQAQTSRLHGLLFTALHWVFLAYAAVRVLATVLASASSFPRRAAGGKGQLTGGDDAKEDTSLDSSSLVGDRGSSKVPVLDFRMWACAANLVDLRSRMPWLSGAISMVQLGLLEGPGRIADLDGVIDR